jgi:hypothetical protein
LLYRVRRYEVLPGRIEAFNRFFHERLLPVQRRHGALLVGRWQTEDGAEVLAVWAYADRDAYRAIQAAVAADADSVAAQQYRREHLEPLVANVTERFMIAAADRSTFASDDRPSAD